MPYLEVRLNNAVIACACADDVGLLTAVVIASYSGHVSVGLSGVTFTGTGKSEHFDWLAKSLSRGDRIEFGLKMSATPTPLKRRTSLSTDPDQIAKALEEMKEQTRTRYPDGIPAIPRAAGPVVLSVSTNVQPPLEASLGEETQLQAVLKWNQQGCTLEVDSVKVLEGGYTKGQHWLSEKLSTGQSVHITNST